MTAREDFTDLEVTLSNRPGALAEFGRVLGAAGVGLEGGGVFTHDGLAIAHFLVDDAERGRAALEKQGIGPVILHSVVTVRLDQDRPGQLGAFAQRVADAGITILVQYSDHDHRLVLVVDPDEHAACRRIAAEWNDQRESRGGPVSSPDGARRRSG